MSKTWQKLAGLSIGAGLVALVVGCASTKAHREEALSPRTLDEVRQFRPADAEDDSHRPKLAVVLGGGGLRGFAHIGVLRALDEAGLRPDIVVGSSAGAVVGAAFASGMTPAQIEYAAREVKLTSLIDWTISSSGLMRGDHIADWSSTLTAKVPIEKFPIRFAAVATDLASGQPVLLDRGSAGRAVQASVAVPGVNVPVPYAAGHLVDGGVSSLVPVRFARALGADIVIAVDIYCNTPRSQGTAMPTVFASVMRDQSCKIAAPEMAEADILISPSIGVSGIAAKQEQFDAILKGYTATWDAMKRNSDWLLRGLGNGVGKSVTDRKAPSTPKA